MLAILKKLALEFLVIAAIGGVVTLLLMTNPVKAYERGGLGLLWAFIWRGGIGTTGWSFEVDLVPGYNVFTVHAYDLAGNAGSAQVTVRFVQDVPAPLGYAIAALVISVAVLGIIGAILYRRSAPPPATSRKRSRRKDSEE